MGRQIDYAAHPVQLPLWERHNGLGAATLASVAEMNDQVFMLLRAQCQVATPQPPLIRDVSGLLLSLDARSAQRAAAAAVLLVDAQFADARQWSDALVGAVNDRPQVTASEFFTVDGTLALMRLVVSHAWHLARSEPAAAQLLLGLSVANLVVIGGCTLSHLTRVAETRTQWLRPRWENRPKIWNNLLRTAAQGDSGVVQRLRVRGLQLLAADARQG